MADARKPDPQETKQLSAGGVKLPPGTPYIGSAPGAPGSVASRYTPGPDAGGTTAGARSEADVEGGGVGGDIDNPDLTGRGSTNDLLGDPGRAASPNPPKQS